jgi:hypothetical protein
VWLDQQRAWTKSHTSEIKSRRILRKSSSSHFQFPDDALLPSFIAAGETKMALRRRSLIHSVCSFKHTSGRHRLPPLKYKRQAFWVDAFSMKVQEGRVLSRCILTPRRARLSLHSHQLNYRDRMSNTAYVLVLLLNFNGFAAPWNFGVKRKSLDSFPTWNTEILFLCS